MKIKLRKTLSELCKDMGLTDKALDELTELGLQGLALMRTSRKLRIYSFPLQR